MFKDDIKTLKEHIYIKRRQVNAQNEIKASLSENDLVLHVDFAESYKNDQQDATQSAHFENQCFSIFTEYCYAYSSNNNDARNDNVIVVTESSDHDRIASMSFLQKVIQKIKYVHEKSYENVYFWSDGMGSKSRSRYIFKLFASKGSMDGIGGTVKNVILRKVKTGQLLVHSPIEFSEAVTKFVPSIHAVYLPENENIVEPEDIIMTRKIDQTLKIHKLEKKCSQNGDTYINFFKSDDDEDPFHVQRYWGKSEIICGHVETSESDKECAKCQESCNEGEEWLCSPVCQQWYQ